MKKKLLAIIFVILLIVIPSGTALADYYADIVLQNTSATAYSMLACNVTANNDYMASSGYFDSVDGLDTRLLLGTAEQKHMLADNRTMFALPVNANSSQTLLFTTGSSNLTHFPVIPGYDGYVTVADAANIELSDNFSVLVEGYIDTTAGVDKNLVYKQDAFKLFVDDTVSGNITALIGDTALNFTGTPDKVERADNALLSAMSPFTIELWIKTTDVGVATQGLTNKMGGADNEWDFLMQPGNDWLRLQIQDPSQGAWIGRSATLAAGINDGAWHYIYASWTGGAVNASIEIWVDDVQEDDADAGGGVFIDIEDTNAPFQVGTGATDASYYKGDIDEVRISDVVRSAAERTATWNGGAGAPFDNDANTVVLWHFNTGQGTTAIDSSSNGLNGTITGATWTDGVWGRKQVSATGLTSGEYEVEVSANTTHLWIAIDGIVKDTTTPFGGVPNNSENWTMYQNNSLIYSDNLSIDINGTTELWYRPTSLIEALSATTGNLTDLTNAYNHGVIHYGANPTGILLSMGGLIYSVGQPEGGVSLVTPDVAPEMETPATMYQDESVWTLTGDPIYAFVNAMSTISGVGGSQISIVLMWFMIHLMAAIIIFFVTFKPMHNLLVSGSLAIAVLGYGVARTQGLIPFWVIIVLIVALLGLIVMERKSSL